MAQLQGKGKSKAKADATLPRMTKARFATLLSLGGRPKQECSAKKRDCRAHIVASYAVKSQPMSEYPKAAIVWYEDNKRRAPLWLLKKAGCENRYAKFAS